MPLHSNTPQPGAIECAAETLYVIPVEFVDCVSPAGWNEHELVAWRRADCNLFVIESFIDELVGGSRARAHAFRRSMLQRNAAL